MTIDFYDHVRWNTYTGQWEVPPYCNIIECIPNVVTTWTVDEEEELKQKLNSLKLTKEIREQVKEKEKRVKKLKEEIAALEKELGISEKAKNQADPCKG